MTGIEEGVAIASLATAAASTAVGVVGGIAQSQALSKQSAYQAQVAANNATIARQNAVQAEQAGEAETEARGLANRAAMGRLLAAQAASGVDVNSGSSVDVRATQDATGLEDVATTQHNAFLKAYGYQSEATGYEATSGLQSAASRNATDLAPLSALSTLAGGASQAGLNATKLYQSGAFSNPSTADSLYVDQTSGF